MASPLENSLIFLEDLGFFDVILPFLLVFTIVFAVLEKTKILGVDEDSKTPKRNLNAIVAFSIALFVVITKQIVVTLRSSLPQVALVLIIIVSLLLLVGSFFTTKEFDYFMTSKAWKGFLTILLLVGVLLIFLGAVETEGGDSFLRITWDWIRDNVGTGAGAISTIIIVGLLVAAIIFVVRKPGGESK